MNLKRISKNNWVIGGLLCFISILGAELLSSLVLFENLELKSLDARFRIRGATASKDTSIVIVAIDDQAFASLKTPWPFPRTYHARVIENLASAGARLIIFDIEFTESSTTDTLGDRLLTQAIRKAGNVILAGKIVTEFGANEILNSYVLKPIKPLEEAAYAWGLVNAIEDPDGFIRKYLLFQKHDQLYFSLSIQALIALMGGSDDVILENGGELTVGNVSIPKYDYNSMLINYRGPAQSFNTYSFADVLDDAQVNLPDDEDTDIFELHKEWGTFKNKIVFIGASAEELQDTKFTPFFEYEGKKLKTPGVETHANALSTILNRDFILPLKPGWTLLIMVAFSGLATVITKSLKPFKGLLLIILELLALTVFLLYLFIEFRLWAHLVTPILAVALTYGGNVVHQVVTEQREKNRFRETFQHYVAPSVVDTMLNTGELPKFGGERRRLTVLFSDIRSFTTYTEKFKHTPEVVVQRLSEYLTAMVDIIFKHNGTLDKFVGDEIMAVYGAPLYFKNHAEKACLTALDMVTELRNIQKQWSEKGWDYFQIGIGINTGEVIVGNLGSVQLFDYTVIGDEVNLAARLEGANKQYWTTIIISEATYNEVKDKALVRELDYVRVKGKATPVKIYELRSMNSLPAIEQDLLIDVYTKALQLYKNRHWYEALKEFRRVLRYFPSDGPSRVYTERCLTFIEHPPAEDWDGVYEFKTK
ncbi:MAG: adenylate/guanylate cyclase domain-containing protein [candidate division KSB1 bacterium]|nr:adenylate/guanylate cyclase domain-containing protein [candidate division KSB1 bacterium]